MRPSSSGRTASVRSRDTTWSIRFRSGSVTHEYKVQYLPAESNTGMFGGNSNWRGPVWMPVNVLIIRALLNLYSLLRRRVQSRVPDRVGQAHDVVRGSERTDTPDRERVPPQCRRERPIYGGTAKFQDDPHWRDLILFHEYFHGDNGAGLGASHQTGWTGLVAPLLDIFGRLDAKTILETERGRLQARVTIEQVAGEGRRTHRTSAFRSVRAGHPMKDAPAIAVEVIELRDLDSPRE